MAQPPRHGAELLRDVAHGRVAARQVERSRIVGQQKALERVGTGRARLQRLLQIGQGVGMPGVERESGRQNAADQAHLVRTLQLLVAGDRGVREAASLGILDGVTTNPSLVAKEGRDFHGVLREIVSIVNGPISAEVTATDKEGMMVEGRELARIHPNIVIKVPLTREGLQSCNALHSEGIKTNVTLCFSPSQALLAAKAGATLWAARLRGKLKGEMSEQGPMGTRFTIPE